MSAVGPSLESYIHDRDPNKFGGRQKEWIVEKCRIEEENSESLLQMKPDAQILKSFFPLFIQRIADQRRAIAVEHGTNASAEFGKRRDSCRGSAITPLIRGSAYHEYNQMFLDQIEEQIRSEVNTKKIDLNKISIVTDEEFEGIKSRFLIEVLNIQQLAERKAFQFTYPDWYPMHLIDENRKVLTDGEEEQFIQADLKFKTNHPDMYEGRELTYLITNKGLNCPPPKKVNQPDGSIVYQGNQDNRVSSFVLRTHRLLVNGKLYRTTRMLTWMHPDSGKEHPLARMKRTATLFLQHQDKHLLPIMVQEMSHLFAEAMLSANQEDFHKNVGKLWYFSSQAMLWNRGSAATIEMLTGAMYRSRQLTPFIDRRHLIDMEIFLSPGLSSFMNKYLKMVTLVPFCASISLSSKYGRRK